MTQAFCRADNKITKRREFISGGRVFRERKCSSGFRYAKMEFKTILSAQMKNSRTDRMGFFYCGKPCASTAVFVRRNCSPFPEIYVTITIIIMLGCKQPLYYFWSNRDQDENRVCSRVRSKHHPVLKEGREAAGLKIHSEYASELHTWLYWAVLLHLKSAYGVIYTGFVANDNQRSLCINEFVSTTVVYNGFVFADEKYAYLMALWICLSGMPNRNE